MSLRYPLGGDPLASHFATLLAGKEAYAGKTSGKAGGVRDARPRGELLGRLGRSGDQGSGSLPAAEGLDVELDQLLGTDAEMLLHRQA
jgi:hypothetical protein